jgi:RNA polymerase sigma-70 factor (ECF subfamily)
VVPGDDSRAADLWDRFADDVYAYARRRVGASVAPDVVAEVFTVVVANPGRVPGDALPWFYRTAWNVIMNLRRADARRAALPDRLPRAAAPADPADVVADREAVLAALDELSEADREAILLVAWEGLDTTRAAAAAGCSAGTFSVRLHRARRRLERALGTAREQAR